MEKRLLPLVCSALFCLLSSWSVASVDTAPVVIWSSSPVRPGESVLLHGDSFGKEPVVELVVDGKKSTVVPSSVSATAVTFVYPESLPGGIVEGIVKNGELASKPFLLNQPDTWWTQGNLGSDASCKNGEVWIFGNSLVPMRGGKVGSVIAMTNLGTGKRHEYNTSAHDPFRIKFEFESLPEGEYSLALSDGGKSAPMKLGTIKVVPANDFWKAEKFNVVDFGAIANDGIDDTSAILLALEKLRGNEGGILYFPRGRFQMTKMIELPPHSAVIGAGQNLAEVYWPDTYEPVDALIKGTHSFGVKDIFLTCGFHKDGIVSNPRPAKGHLSEEEKANSQSGNVYIHDVTLRLLYSQFINDSHAERERRLKRLHFTRALRLAGDNVQVRRCDIYCAAGGVFELAADWGIFDDNKFSRGNIIGWNGFSGQHLIFEHNSLRGANCTSFYGLPEGSENIFWGFNFHENNFDGNNRETITGDGRVHSYMDTIENITPDSFTLKPDENGKVVWTGGEHLWSNGAVQIAGGKGVGQFRRIKKIEGARVEVDPPWDVVPDETSVINIGSFRRRFIYAENSAFDSTCALQFYGSMIEGIFARNTTARTGGYNADAMTGESNWFNQFFDNTIETGNSYRGPRNEVPPLDAQLGLLAYGNGNGKQLYPLVRGCALRGNRLMCNAKINVMGNVQDSVIENNHIAEADRGIVVSETARNIVLRNNTFDHVSRPYTTTSQSVVLSPWEEIKAGIQSAAWLLADDEIKYDDVTPENAGQRLIETTKYISNKFVGKQVPLEVVENLLGVVVEPVNWTSLAALLRDGEAGSGALRVLISNSSRVDAKLTMEVRPDDLPLDGWEFKFPLYHIVPRKAFFQNMKLTKPEGEARFLSIPITCTLEGDGWKLTYQKRFADPWDSIVLTSWKVSQKPLENQNTTPSKISYVAHKDLPQVPADSLVPCTLEKERFAFASAFGESDSGKLMYAVTHIQAKKNKKVRFDFSRDSLLYVNGTIVGTAQGRGQWGFVELQEGDNVVELLACPNERDEYRIGLPRITYVESALPGDLLIEE